MKWQLLLVSLLIAASGWFGARILTGVDQDLRVIYAEYTLAATDLGHVNGELIRYRSTILRAIEADTKEDFDRIAASLPNKQARIDGAIKRFVSATDNTTSGHSIRARELMELNAVREKLENYLASSHETIRLMEKRWKTSSPVEARQLRDQAERHASKEAGSKFISVTLELDQLLDVVAEIAGEVRKEADYTLRMTTVGFIVASSLLTALVLYLPL
jgi:hypothetical protein